MESKTSKSKKSTINVQGMVVTVVSQQEDDFISLTDIARHRDSERTDYIIQNWMRTRNTIEFLGLWEQLNNPRFKPIEFEGLRNQAGLNSFSLTAKRWIDATGATGLVSKSGRYGGTFAHKDIAFEFASWISVEFKLYLIKEFQRLKTDESRRLSLDWNLSRTLSKLNYRIHTDAIKAHLIPAAITPEQTRQTYASEADVLNMALFGQTAKQWRDVHPDLEGNMRDDADVTQLLVLANLESLNAEFIHMGLGQAERLIKLNQNAIRQLQSLAAHVGMKSFGLLESNIAI
jgi:KilA-N domain